MALQRVLMADFQCADFIGEGLVPQIILREAAVEWQLSAQRLVAEMLYLAVGRAAVWLKMLLEFMSMAPPGVVLFMEPVAAEQVEWLALKHLRQLLAEM